ncbi:MAG: serine--tRNA ligase [Gammaproteobacteria bacterium]|nr:serine--tRNA ligase [Gammaproteobacteria bacterium]
MLEIKWLKNNLAAASENLTQRGFKLEGDKLEALESERKAYQIEAETLQAQRNTQAKQIGMAKAKGENIEPLLVEGNRLAEEIKTIEAKLHATQEILQALLLTIPNLLHETVPTGTSEMDNQEIRRHGEPAARDFTPRDHVDLATTHGWIDFDQANKLSGSRFTLLRGPLAQLQRALAQFMLDLHCREHGYEELYVPYLVNRQALYGSGQLPKFADDLFHLDNKNDYFLISTAEIPLTNMVADKLLEQAQLPLKFVSHTPCFRSEAGSYGKDTRGMIRQHQFEKVELVQIVSAENSYAALEELTGHAEKVLQRLELPYRVVALCSGDIGFSAAKTYDLEVWLPGQQCYREISSCSNCEAFQARRMKARYRDKNSGKSTWLHTLNGSGLAVGRALIAVMENYQDAAGNIHIPTALQPYMNGQQVIK